MSGWGVLHPVLNRLCEIVGYMMNRVEVASDGKTPYERVKGKRSEVVGLEFCEKVLWKYHPGKRMVKVDLWLVVGVTCRSGELIVVDGREQGGEVCPDDQAHPGGGKVGPK